MLLLIPDAIRKLKEEGRQEGRQEGWKEEWKENWKKGWIEGWREGRQEQNDRLGKAFRQFGKVVDGATVLPRTPEVEAFLSGSDSNG